MCDPLTLLGIAGGVAGALFSPKPKDPPAPAIPAAPAPSSKQPGATVRVGSRGTQTKGTTEEFTGFTEKRKSGKSLGNVGRSGLTI